MNAKDVLKGALAQIYDLAAAVRGRQPKLTILYYHAVPEGLAGAFEAQMAYLEARANIVDPDHEGPLDPHRPNVAVAFDDAFRSVREYALPALVRHRVRATIYVPSGWLGRSPGWEMETYADRDEIVMSADELRSLPGNLIRFGSHTIDHPHLPALSDDAVRQQLCGSRAALEDLLGVKIDTLAFPYGEYDDRAVAMGEEAGYRRLFTVAPQAIRADATHILRGRTAVEPSDPPSLFALKSRGAFDWMPLASRLKATLRPR